MEHALKRVDQCREANRSSSGCRGIFFACPGHLTRSETRVGASHR